MQKIYRRETEQASADPLLRLALSLLFSDFPPCFSLKCSQSYTFRCHRTEKVPNKKNEMLVYSVNDVKFHPVHGTFSTAGSDGTVSIWDKDQRTRLKSK